MLCPSRQASAQICTRLSAAFLSSWRLSCSRCWPTRWACQQMSVEQGVAHRGTAATFAYPTTDTPLSGWLRETIHTVGVQLRSRRNGPPD